MAVNVNEKGKTESRPPVSVKGVKDGLLFLVDEQCEFETIVEYLHEIFNGHASGLFSGPDISVSVDYGSRTFTKDETQQLLQVFSDQENFTLREWGAQTNARQSLFTNRHRLQRQTIYKGTVRNGQQLFFDGDVVVIGDVNPGAQIAATGDIFVFGRLRGIAHAGAQGNEQSIIAAADFAPMQLRIADIVSRAPEVDGRVLNTFMEFAYLREGGMAVDKIHYAPSIRSNH